MDPVLLTLYRHRFAGISEEMGVTLQRTSYSPNIKERLDFSCAVFDAAGNMVAQAAHIPVHLGAMPASVEAALRTYADWQPGDVIMLNDPYEGGTHLPDVTLVSPVFVDVPDDRATGAPVFFIASRAHHADIGGMTPGSLPLSTEIYQEGLIIPPVRLYHAGVLNEDLLRLVLRNVRTPEERKGDLAAQRAAHEVGERRLREMVQQFGLEEVHAYAGHVRSYSNRMIHAAIASWPDGVYTCTDYLELDAEVPGGRVPIVLNVTIKGGTIVFDFAGTGTASQSSLNAVLSITQSACYYVVISLAGDDIPVNSGCFSSVEVKAPAGSVVNAMPPAAVAGGNVETSQRIVDTAFCALAGALPDRVPAGSQGTMNNLTIGGQLEDGTPFAYYETIAGGMGATADADGLDGVHVHMSNTLNTPVEALEMAFPFRLNTYALRTDEGGAGKKQGGRGVVREYLFLRDVTATMLSERRAIAPAGLAGGGAGHKGVNTLIAADGNQTVLPSKFSRRFKAGESLRIETPGGGGWGE